MAHKRIAAIVAARKNKYMFKKQVIEIPVNVKNLGKVIEDVFCRIEVPNKVGEEISILLFPTQAQFMSIGRAAHFSIEGTIKPNDSIDMHVKSDDVWCSEIKSKHIAPNLFHITMYAQAMKLSIFNALSNDVKTLEDASAKFRGHFLISESNLLKPFKLFTRSFTGERKLDSNDKLKFPLQEDLFVEFDTFYKYDEKDNITFDFPYLVAVFETDHSLNVIESIEHKLTDLLLLTSFAECKSVICFGKELYTDKYRLSIYEKRWVSDKPDPFEALIDIKHFVDFAKSAFTELNKSLFKKDIIQAIYGLTSLRGTIEYSFISLFSSLESIITSYKKYKGLDRIFNESEWKQFKEDFKTSIKANNLLKNDKPKRALLYEKLDELNRPSFKYGIKALIDEYKIPLEGLWPIISDNNEISLLEIRNRLVHGENHSRLNYSALQVAFIHLEWIVRRTILRLLNWDVENTSISSKRIGQQNPSKQVSEMMKSFFMSD